MVSKGAKVPETMGWSAKKSPDFFLNYRKKNVRGGCFLVRAMGFRDHRLTSNEHESDEISQDTLLVRAYFLESVEMSRASVLTDF